MFLYVIDQNGCELFSQDTQMLLAHDALVAVRVDLVRTRSAWPRCFLSAIAASSIASTRLVMVLAEEGERCDMFVVKGDDFILLERRVTVI